jgi:DNA-binding CsgD family transcriptional regulator
MVLSRSDETDLLIPIYEGVHEASPWRRFLTRLQHRTRADHAALILRQGSGQMHEGTQFFAGADIRARVQGVLPAERAVIDAIPFDKLKPGRVYNEDEFIEFGGVRQHRQYRDYHTKIGVGSVRVMRIVAQEGLWAWLVIVREVGEFSAADGALLSAIAPNFAVALEIFATLERARFRLAAAEDVMARAGIGWMALDAKGQRVDASPIGDRLVSVSGGRTTPRRGDEEDRCGAIDWIVEAFSGARPLVASALPTEIAYARAAPEGGAQRGGVLERLHGLSPQEARLTVALANGQSLGDAAAALGLTLETARNYSKRIFAKTHTRGQADLVRLVLTGPASLA